MKKLSLFISFVLLASSCAPLRVAPPAERWWPLPPDPPRISFVQRINGSRFIQRKKKNFLLRERLGVNLRTIDLVKPYDVAVTPEGRIYISDTGRTGVVWLDPNTDTFGILGGQGDFGIGKALGLDLDHANNLFVADGPGRRVVVFNTQGKGQRVFGNSEILERPAGIAVDQARNRVYVSDSKSHDIEVFDMAGEHVATLGERGSGDGQFNFPTHLAVGDDGTLYVADSMNFRIQRWDAEGNFIDAFGKAGNIPGTFFRLKGIDVDSEGRVWAVDASFGVVQIFDKDWNLLLVFSNYGDGEGDLNLAAGLDLTASGDLYVASQITRTIEQFHFLQGDEIEAAAARRAELLSGDSGDESTPAPAPAPVEETVPEGDDPPPPTADEPPAPKAPEDGADESTAPASPELRPGKRSTDLLGPHRRTGRPTMGTSPFMPAKR